MIAYIVKEHPELAKHKFLKVNSTSPLQTTYLHEIVKIGIYERVVFVEFLRAKVHLDA